MKWVILFFLGWYSGSVSLGQAFSEASGHCQCTVERVSGDYDSAEFRVSITVWDQEEEVAASLAGSIEAPPHYELFITRKRAYPSMYLTYQQQTYTLDMPTDQLYAGSTVLGEARNLAEAVEVLITQVLLPDLCLTARATDQVFPPDREVLLPGRFYN